MKKIYILFILLINFIGFAQEQTMYWIGGAGNWDDLSHWSFQSGSQDPNTQPSSIPNAQTNVIFDENSGLAGVDAERTVTIRLGSYNIKSLSFTNGISQATAPIINKAGDYSISVSDNVTFQPFVRFNVALIGNVSEGETKTITMNGILSSGALFEIGKEGLGTLTVDESLNNTNVTVNYGTLKLFGQQLTGGALAVYNNAVLEILNLTTINVNSFRTDATAYVNLPNCTNMNVTGNFSPNSSIPINFPLLINLSVGKFQTYDYSNSVLSFPDNCVINIAEDFLNPNGTINYSTATFIVANGNVFLKNQTHLHELIMNHPVGTTAFFNGAIILDELTVFYANVDFKSNVSVGHLVLAPSATYTISENITITESLIASSPDCTAFISFTTPINYYGNASIKNNTAGVLQMTNAIVSNLVSNGLNPINVVGVNNGGNSGSFVFTEPAETILYWVGDANDGEWHNINNWAQTSGGQGGYCIPNRFTNVVFDENSVITDSNLKVTNNPARFHDMVIADDAPAFNINGFGDTGNLSCYGSWTMRSGISVNLDTYFLSNDTSEAITSNSSSFGKVFFNGSTMWVLQDNFINTDHLIFNGGTLNTNDKTVFIGGDFQGEEQVIFGTPQRSLILGSSEISVFSRWEYGDSFSLLDAGNSHIILRNGQYFFSNSLHEYYDITSEVSSDTQKGNLLVVSGKLNAHDVVIRASTAEFGEQVIANLISMMPRVFQANLFVIDNLTTNVLELQKNAIMLVTENKIVTINTGLITHTNDCDGMMQIKVSEDDLNQKFVFKSLINIHIPNVWMTGVEADTSTGVNYTATGIEDGLTQNWTFVTSPIKDLYWVGTEDDNWNNKLNWTTNSDGTPSVDGCVPDHNDNVHFNVYSANSLGSTIIQIFKADAFISNIFVHDDFQGSLRIGSGISLNRLYIFGNTVQLKEAVNLDIEVFHHGKGDVIYTGGEFNNTIIYYLELLGEDNIQNWNFNKNISISSGLSLNKGVFNYSYPTFKGGSIHIVDGVFNSPSILEIGSLYFTKGIFNAQNSLITAYKFESNSDNDRFLNIQNTTFLLTSSFSYSGDNLTLFDSGSLISISEVFESNDGLNFNHIETFKASNSNNLVNINGFFNVNKLTLSNNTKINNNLQIGELVILPKNLTLSLAENTTQTITNKMQLNGTPCQFNTIQGLGTGADIAYANPNDNNTFDFVQVSGINATDANINFQVNSSNLGNNNNKVVFLQGSTGVIGLGPDKTCKDSFYILAYGFYGGPLSAYTWYKKDENGDFINLNLPPETISINAIDYGLDGVYKVDMVYDTTLDVNLQCKQSSTVHITFAPMNVGFVNNPATFCENEMITIGDILITQETQDFMDEFNSEILWFANATDSTPLATTSILVDGTTYYATLLDDNGCYSNDRMPVLVEFYAKPIANAGPDQIVTNQTLFTMQANNPAVGVGTWSLVSGDVSITDVNSYNTTVTLLSGESATLRWTVDNNGCTSSDVVKIGKFISGNHVPRVNPSLRSRVF